MNSLLQIARLTFVQAVHQTRSWVIPVLLCVAVALSARGGITSWGDFYHTSYVPLLLLFLPLFACSGIVSQEVESGRAMVLHSLGVSRRAFIVGRAAGGTVLCLVVATCIQLLVGTYLIFAHHGPTLRGALGALIGLAFCFAYSTCLLVFLSTVLRSWGNTAVMFALAYLIYPFVDHLGREMPNVLWLSRLILLGPYELVLRGSESKPFPVVDIAVVVGACALLTSAAIFLYRRSEIGKIAGHQAS
jgi:ABC-type transport system involved in multi-copper enzyme maturation permease subunit